MIQLGKYEILEEIGRGGFAVVYKARDTDLERVVALKVLHAHWSTDPDFVTRFRQEARGAANLRHPNIVTVHEAGEAEGQLFTAMEYVPGRTLRELLETEGALRLERASALLEQVADALDYAHGQGVIHRDVKPANIMVEETERGQRATLMDFGLVKAMAGSTALTSMGTLLGSPEYMAPEQADPERAAEVGPAADRYALGIVAYQMLTGRVPFPGNTPATLNAHLNLDPPDPQGIRADLPSGLSQALLKMLDKNPGERFASARAFAVRLDQALREAGQEHQLEDELASLYEQLQAAAAEEQWAAVLALGGQIQAREADYRDATTLMEQARARQSRARPAPQAKPSVSRSLPSFPRWIWAAGAVGLVAVLFIIALALRDTGSGLGAGDTRTRPADGMVLVYVPGGTFEMGATDGDDNEQPVHSVTLTSFWMDRTEVTNAQYQNCVEGGACKEPICWDDSDLNAADQPVVCVSWFDAQGYCVWAGARLPTEAEWEYAARGTQGNIYPWGNDEPDCDKASYWHKEDGCVANPTFVGSHPDGASWCEALDMAGNVWEWVNDRYGDYPSTAQTNPTGPETGEYRVLRGGSWISGLFDVRSVTRIRFRPQDADSGNGFRCVGGSTP